jgi:hypothetical protein
LVEKMSAIEKIKYGNEILAILVRKEFDDEGLKFVTPSDYGLQLGIHNQGKDTKARPHVHKPIKNLKSLQVQELFYVIKGKIRIGLYKDDEKVRECIVNSGDTVLLVSGHSIEFLEHTKMIEVKQGPYRGVEMEKRFIES